MTTATERLAGFLLGSLLLGACSTPVQESSSTTSLRTVDTTSRTDFIVGCLREGGVPAEALPDGMVLWQAQEDQLEAFDAIEMRCIAEADQRFPVPAAPVTREERSAFYEQLLETAECLRAEGYEPPPAPSLETFLDTYDASPWHPYESVHPGALEEWYRINAVCPQPP